MNRVNFLSKVYLKLFGTINALSASDIQTMKEQDTGDDSLIKFYELFKLHGKKPPWDKKGVYLIYKRDEILYAGENDSSTHLKSGTLLQRLGHGHIYGGASKDLRDLLYADQRLNSKTKKDCIKYIETNDVRAKFMLVESDDLRRFLELQLICKFCPTFNNP